MYPRNFENIETGRPGPLLRLGAGAEKWRGESFWPSVRRFRRPGPVPSARARAPLRSGDGSGMPGARGARRKEERHSFEEILPRLRGGRTAGVGSDGGARRRVLLRRGQLGRGLY